MADLILFPIRNAQRFQEKSFDMANANSILGVKYNAYFLKIIQFQRYFLEIQLMICFPILKIKS